METINTLPQKWCVRMDRQEVIDYCNKYGKCKPYFISNNLFAHFPPFSNCLSNLTSSYRIEPRYTLISFERFKKLVLDTEEFVVPDKFCIYTKNPDIIQWFVQKLNRNIAFGSEGSVFHYPEFDGCCTGRRTHTELGYKEITEDQFIEHILKPKTMKEDKELIGYKSPYDINSEVPKGSIYVKDYDNFYCVKGKSGDGSKYYLPKGIVENWLPVYKDQEKVLYFGKVKFIIKPRSNVASTVYGDIPRSAIKNAIDYISNPPSLIGHEFNIHIGSSEPKSLVDIGFDKVTHHKIGFGCQSGTLEELINIYNAFN